MQRKQVVVITGGAHGIGKALFEFFTKQKAIVCLIDKQNNPYFVKDLTNKTSIETFVTKVIDEHGAIDLLINYEEFQEALSVSVTAPFYLSKLFVKHINPNGSIINISSTREFMSQS